MKKLYEKDLDSLEECTINIYKDCVLETWSADNNFEMSVYVVTTAGNRVMVETISSDQYNGITIEFTRLADGNIYAKHVMHGQDDYTASYMDAHYTANDVDYFIISCNEAVTVRMYD